MANHKPAARQASTGDVDLAYDRQLVERAQVGDEKAFGQLYAWYNQRVVAYCKSHLGDASEAEDASQEAFVRAWRALGTLGGDCMFYPWLRVIAHNVCVDSNKRRRALPTADAQLAAFAAAVPSGEDDALNKIDRELVMNALQNLSTRHREILKLREECDLSYQAIAEHEGVAVSTIETRLFRARRALRKEFMGLVGGDGLAAMIYLPLLRRLGWLIGVHRINPETASETTTIAARWGTISGIVATAAIAGVIVVGPSLQRGEAPPAGGWSNPLAVRHATNSLGSPVGSTRRVTRALPGGHARATIVTRGAATRSGSLNTTTPTTSEPVPPPSEGSPTDVTRSTKPLDQQPVPSTAPKAMGLGNTAETSLPQPRLLVKSVGVVAQTAARSVAAVLNGTNQTAATVSQDLNSGVDAVAPAAANAVGGVTSATNDVVGTLTEPTPSDTSVTTTTEIVGTAVSELPDVKSSACVAETAIQSATPGVGSLLGASSDSASQSCSD